MNNPTIDLHVGEDPVIELFLEQRICEFNAKETGYFDAEAFSATHRDERGSVLGGICG